MTLELIAPAKLNLALEVLGRRPDGYHEIVSLMQAIDLADKVRLSEANEIELRVSGDQALGVPLDATQNLAYRAAVALRQAAGRPDLGARIGLEKNIPASAGLGGGSSDAAAVLRGVNRLWGLDLKMERLDGIAAELGSDVAFFLHGGTALASGRGERIESLQDALLPATTLFMSSSDSKDKTRRMYSLLTPADFTDGRHVATAAQTTRRGLPLSESDYVNTFDKHLAKALPQAGAAMACCRDAGLTVTACGSGPSFFSAVSLDAVSPGLLDRLRRDFGVMATAVHGLSRTAATAAREL